MRRNTLVAGVAVIVVVWIVVVTVLIARQPEPGVATPAQLRQELELALDSRDVERFARLTAYPPGELDEFASAYLDEFRRAGAHDVTVTLRPNDQRPTVATVSGKRARGAPFSYDIAVGEAGGRWRIEFTPPL
ncbi:hypothetical protein SacmaDRAFT_4884 [Saccharomonospora marina XMU15]|uniref:DUF4878 domain-containing protein n=1 Tax=Saccharomonospora marina XMU15 TaxID=882083 RepID=H5X061_9PSEU|nr:hypothetical protein [Saccharomonospora marina]EHR53057.1 hypothetical protein SacmaDRAFT_4884 [Saccharomonospora marina XMU15]